MGEWNQDQNQDQSQQPADGGDFGGDSGVYPVDEGGLYTQDDAGDMYPTDES